MIAQCNKDGLDSQCSEADNFCYNQVEYVLDAVTGRDEYDIRELTPDPFPYEFYVDYLNTPKVQVSNQLIRANGDRELIAMQRAIGAYVNYSESNSAVSNAFGTTGDDGRVLTAVSDMVKLVEANLTVIMYFGGRSIEIRRG
jgi:hypothetical protein